MGTEASFWQREGTIASAVSTSLYNPVEAICRLQDGVYHWSVRVGSRGHKQNVVANWEELSPAVELGVRSLVEGEANISGGPGCSTPVPLSFDINWPSDWVVDGSESGEDRTFP